MHFSTSFICGDRAFSTNEGFVNAPYIRKTFNIEAFNNARISICGLGFYRLFVNGTEITRGLLSPYISNPDDVVYYDEYDVTALIKKGENCIGIMLGNGMQNALGGENWRLNVGEFVGSPKVALSFVKDGALLFEADETFKWTESPVLFDDLRYGTHYDARLEIENWNLACFDDSLWKNCQYASVPKGERVLGTVPPIKKICTVYPERIIKSSRGYIYDFGYNSAGLCQIKIKGERGQRLTLYYGEVVLDGELDLENLYNSKTNRELAHKDIYVLKGTGEDVYEPSFTYHGFQYVLVEGLTEEQATKELLTYHVYSTDFDELTEFECSDPIVNKLQTMCKNSARSNFYHIPTDCPHREKNGWTGDAALSAEYMLFNYSSEINFKEWMRNVRGAQNDEGTFPGIVPTTGWGFEWGNGPAWDQVIGVIPYYVYKYTGDTEILKENAPALFRYLKYMMTKKGEHGFAYGLGDWCEVNTWNPTTPLEVTDTLTCYNLTRIASFIFKKLDMKAEYEYSEKIRQEIYRDFRSGYLNEDGTLKIETQAAYALMIAYGMFTEAESKIAVERLVEIIRENNGKMCVGILGARELFHVLSRYGYGDLALKMIIGPEFPSWGEWAKKGQTALWERFYETEAGESLKRVGGGSLTSLNHHMFGDISSWFLKNILGINVNPNGENHKHILIKPCTLKEMDYALGSYKRDNGAVFVSWKKENGKMFLIVKCDGDFTVEYDFSCVTCVNKTANGNETVLEILTGAKDC